MSVRNRIATTSSATVRPLAFQAVQVSSCYVQLVSLLESNLGQEEAHFFAEPEISAGAGEIDWYVSFSGNAIPLSALSQTEQQTVRERIEAIAKRIKALADRLCTEQSSNSVMAGSIAKLALQYPGQEYIYVVGSQPVLVNWGFSLASAAAAPESLTRFSETVPAAVSVPLFPVSEPAGPQTTATEVETAPVNRRPVASASVQLPQQDKKRWWLLVLGCLGGFLLVLLLLYLLSWSNGWPEVGFFSGCSRQVQPPVVTEDVPHASPPLVEPTPELEFSLKSTEVLHAERLQLQAEYLRRLQGCPPIKQPEPALQPEEPQMEPLRVPPEPKAEVVPNPEVEPEVVTPKREQSAEAPDPEVEPAEVVIPEQEPLAEAPAQGSPKKERAEPPKKKLGEKLHIPEDAAEKGDMSFLEGCWYADLDKDLINLATGLPITIKYCFDGAGRGVEYVQEYDAKKRKTYECKGSLTAVLSDDGVLLIDDKGSVMCSDGQNYLPERVHCKDNGTEAICTETLRRKWKRVPFIRTTR